MVRPVFIIAFTGHRTSDAVGRSRAELEGTRDLVRVALSDMRERAQRVGGEVHLFCSAAEGADVISGEVALELSLIHI